MPVEEVACTTIGRLVVAAGAGAGAAADGAGAGTPAMQDSHCHTCVHKSHCRYLVGVDDEV